MSVAWKVEGERFAEKELEGSEGWSDTGGIEGREGIPTGWMRDGNLASADANHVVMVSNRLFQILG